MEIFKFRTLVNVKVKEIAWLINVIVEEEDLEFLENAIRIITKVLNANQEDDSGCLKIILFFA